MLLVSFLVCSAGFTSNYFNLTNIFIQISGMNMDAYRKVFSTTQENLTINSSEELVEDNNCYRVSYYIENETDPENTTTTCHLDNITNGYNSDNQNSANMTYSAIMDYILNISNSSISSISSISSNSNIFKTVENLYLTTRAVKSNVRTIIEKRMEQFIEKNKIDKDLINALKGVILVNIILILGFGVAILVFSFSYKVMKDDFPEDMEDYVAYEDKYDKEFYDLERKELTEAKKEELKNNYVRDTTPNGEIIMYYDFETSSFKYYFNNKNAITYPELEAVAKLFTVKNNCRYLFIEDEKNSDNEEQTPETTQPPETRQTPETTQTPETDEEKPKKKSSVFAVVKKYNKQDNKSKDERDKHGKITRDNNKRSREENIERLDKVKKLGNHFKHVGKIYDFEEEQKGETIKQEILNNKPPPLPPQPAQSPPPLPPPPPEPSTETTKTETSNNLKVFDDSNMVLVERPRDVSPPGKLLKKTSKIMPKNNISFAEYKKQVLEPNRKNK